MRKSLFLLALVPLLSFGGSKFFEDWTSQRSNQSLTITPTGTGETSTASNFNITSDAELRLQNVSGNYVGLVASQASTNQTYVLPPEDGTTGYVLQTDGAGNLTWVAVDPGATGFTDQSILYADTDGTITEDNGNYTWDNANSIMNMGASGGVDGELRIYSSSGNYVGLKSDASGNQTYTLPVIDGGPEDILQTDGAGNLSWIVAPGGIDAWASSTDYEAGDVVHESFKIYLANTNHTSTGSFAADIANWDELSEDSAIGGTEGLVRFSGSDGTFDEHSSLSYASDNTVFTVGNVDIDGVNASIETDAATDLTLAPGTTGDLVLDLQGGQPYNFSIDGTNALSLQGQTSAVSSSLFLFSADGDASDNVNLALFGSGSPDGSNEHFLTLQWDQAASQYEVQSASAGTASTEPLVIHADDSGNQLFLNTDGNVGIGTSSTATELTVGGDLTLLNQNEIRLEDVTGGQYTGFKAPIAVTPNAIYTLPGAGGENTTALLNNGSDTLSWEFVKNNEGNLVGDFGFEGETDPWTHGSGSGVFQSSGGIAESGYLSLQTGTAHQHDLCLSVDTYSLDEVKGDLEVGAFVKTTLTDLEYCYYDGTNEDDCSTYSAGDNEWIYVYKRGQSVSGEDVCLRLKSTSTSAIGVDNGHVGLIKFNTAELENDTDWEDCGLVSGDFSGFGTVTSIDIDCRRDDNSLKMKGRFTLGTTVASTASMTIPDGHAVDSSVPATSVLEGRVSRSASTATLNDFSAVAGTGDTTIKFGVYNNGSNSPTSTLDGSAIGSSSDVMHINIEIPIEGWSATSTNVITPASVTTEGYTLANTSNFWDTTASTSNFDISLIDLTESKLIEWNDTTQTRLVAKRDVNLHVTVGAYSLTADNQMQVLDSSGNYLAVNTARTDQTTETATSVNVQLDEGDYIYFTRTTASARNGSLTIIAYPTEAEVWAAVPIEQFQTKTLSGTVSATDSDISSLRFDNLEVGKCYEIKGGADCSFSTTSTDVIFTVNHDSSGIARGCGQSVGSQVPGRVFTAITSGSFIATATSVITSVTINSTGTLNTTGTFLQLIEKPCKEVSKW